jgi:hypothetical protein
MTYITTHIYTPRGWQSMETLIITMGVISLAIAIGSRDKINSILRNRHTYDKKELFKDWF